MAAKPANCNMLRHAKESSKLNSASVLLSHVLRRSVLHYSKKASLTSRNIDPPVAHRHRSERRQSLAPEHQAHPTAYTNSVDASVNAAVSASMPPSCSKCRRATHAKNTLLRGFSGLLLIQPRSLSIRAFLKCDPPVYIVDKASASL